MNLETVGQFVSNVGIPGALLIYLVWRLDKFLTFLCAKLTTYNKEFRDISFAINGVIEELRDIKKIFNSKGKN